MLRQLALLYNTFTALLYKGRPQSFINIGLYEYVNVHIFWSFIFTGKIRQ